MPGMEHSGNSISDQGAPGFWTRISSRDLSSKASRSGIDSCRAFRRWILSFTWIVSFDSY